jgi:hypothetical protein
MSSSSTIEDRVSQLESNHVFDVTQAAVRQREIEFLTTLRQIKSQIDDEKMNAAGGAGAGGGGGTAEIDTLKAENIALKAQVAKQEYRIRHLIEAMETKQIWKS